MKNETVEVKLYELETRSALIILERFSRDKLRQLAEDCGVPKGRDKRDTIRNLVASQRVTLSVTLV